MSPAPEGFIRIGTLAELRRRKCIPTESGSQPIAVFYNEGQVSAIQNRCTHLNYPLQSGTIQNGVLTCIWHQARFNLSTGECLGAAHDDVLTFPVTIVDDEVWVSPIPNAGD